MHKAFSHVPVLLQECLDGLCIRWDGDYADGTAGGAGHSQAIVSRLTTGRLFAFDKDPDALKVVRERLQAYPNAQVVESDFSQMPQMLSQLEVKGLDGILLDLGVSSFQLDTAERGFSYKQDAPLDMRMTKSGKTAADILNTYDFGALCTVLRKYGEEKFSPQITKAILRKREEVPFTHSEQLVEVIRAAIPAKARREGGHPAKRVFQALRIEVNGELDSLEVFLRDGPALLKTGGRLCIITFHSLEDRLVKNAFLEHSRGCTCPSDFPVCICGKTPQFRVVTKKPILASEQELTDNSRSQSAKLRILEKL